MDFVGVCLSGSSTVGEDAMTAGFFRCGGGAELLLLLSSSSSLG
jgi:hypothetical protein